MVCLLLLSFVFTQLAVAAYVCPGSVDTTHAERRHLGEGDCHRPSGSPQDRDDPQLCKAYCERGAQAKPNGFADLTDLAAFPCAPAPIYRESVQSSDRYDVQRGHCVGPPLYLLNCVLRN